MCYIYLSVVNMKCGLEETTVNMNQPKTSPAKRLNAFHYPTISMFVFSFPSNSSTEGEMGAFESSVHRSFISNELSKEDVLSALGRDH